MDNFDFLPAILSFVFVIGLLLAALWFLKARNLAGLTSASDPKNTLLRALGGRGLPTTYLIDAEGRVLGHVEGDAAWDGAEARALIDYYLAAAGG